MARQRWTIRLGVFFAAMVFVVSLGVLITKGLSTSTTPSSFTLDNNSASQQVQPVASASATVVVDR